MAEVTDEMVAAAQERVDALDAEVLSIALELSGDRGVDNATKLAALESAESDLKSKLADLKGEGYSAPAPQPEPEPEPEPAPPADDPSIFD
jgi:hypothetical protein